MSSRITRVLVACMVALLACAGLAQRAGADVVTAAWSDPVHYTYEIRHVPDFDQVRCGTDAEGGLPNCGRCYCVSTSLMNLFGYAANHGFPEVNPGPGVWQSQDRYLDASDAIRLMGAMCATDPSSGATHFMATLATRIWLASSGRFVVHHVEKSTFYAPTHGTLAKYAIGGGIVTFAFGRYDIVEDGGGMVQIGERHGGHQVTLARIARAGDSMILEVRDPGNGGDDFDQSSFGNTVYQPREHVIVSTSPLVVRPMTSLNHPVGDGRIRLVESMISIRPKAAYSWQSSLLALDIATPFPLDPQFPAEFRAELAVPLAVELVDAALIADQARVAVITSQATGGGKLGIADLLDDSYVELGPTAPRAQVTVGRHGLVYELSGQVVKSYNPADDEPLLAGLELLAPGTDIAYDDARDEVLVYVPTLRTVYFTPYTLDGYQRKILPAVVPLSDDGEIMVGPNEAWWVHPKGEPTLFRFRYLPSGAYTMHALADPAFDGLTGFDVDDDERLFACVDNVVREYAYDDDLDEWVRASDSPSGLDGTPCSGRMFVTRSRSNFNEADMTGPGYYDFDPAELAIGDFVADCPGDVDGDAFVGVIDLLEVLAAWGPCGACSADVNRDGIVDVLDLLEVLGNWGACPE